MTTGDSVFDIIVIFFLLITALFSFFKGFAKDFISTICIIIAILSSYLFGNQIINILKPYIHQPLIGYVIAGSVTFIVILILSNIILRKLLKPLLSNIPLSIDKSFGFLFGIFKGYVILSFAFGLIIALSSSNLFYFMQGKADQNKYGPNWLQKSHSYPVLDFGSQKIYFIIEDIMPYFAKSKKDREDAAIKTKKTNNYNKKKPSIDVNAKESGGYDSSEIKKMNNIINIISIINNKNDDDKNNNNIKDDNKNNNNNLNLRNIKIGDYENKSYLVNILQNLRKTFIGNKVIEKNNPLDTSIRDLSKLNDLEKEINNNGK